MTEAQRRVVDAVIVLTARHGTPPTLREVGEHVGARSVGTIRKHVMALRGKWLEWQPGSARTLRIRTPAEAYTCTPPSRK